MSSEFFQWQVASVAQAEQHAEQQAEQHAEQQAEQHAEQQAEQHAEQQAEQHAEHQFSHVDHVLMIATPLAGTLADLAVLICYHLKIVSKIFRRNVPLDGNLTPDAPEADSTEPNPLHKINLFFGIIATQVQQAIDDEHDNSGSLAFSDKWVPIKIADLFQLESPYWKSLYGRFAVLTLEDRLEFYELLDKDAEGELVDDEGLDLSIGAVVMDGF
ncbi:hypothetical protein AGABI2DRAFT_123283 [Agaricus bisporus var. bisporus H97]|uniref:hypothetical protein n=1 Tax=Agaricus bisporus var. bisporus (strain H97 / ATCC MYA-4626 / FGSC 10389) TaxID=936046 RepID=UPI00029F6500|nr:hypothetical protein AGABI2DRAFT_123283 [Agaricus bisporus var. bisporus H97]EKV41804.1 hypothetical protein AGABI2DRAFT_123283 [Agaricus bisporus var. bisporus H97]